MDQLSQESRKRIHGILIGQLFRPSATAGAWLLASLVFASPVVNSQTDKPKAPMTQHAKGTFQVKMGMQKPDNPISEAAGLLRMTIDKQFHGDLEGTSKGEMLASGKPDPGGSGGYVAQERVTGALKGRHGTFVLQHTGTMTRGTPELIVMVVPDSGTDQLTGLAGKFTIIIENGNHSYDFEYTLPEKP